MHHALEIQEILLNIFGHCYPPGTPSAASSLAALARSCRTFKDPALDVLWGELDDLSPLVKCIPGATRRLFPGNVYSLSRPLTEAEWDILQSYTFRVRSVLDFNGGLTHDTLRILSDPPTTELLFPNLHQVYCEYTTETVHLLHLPLPSLISLDLILNNPHWFRDSLESLPELSPNIKRLSLHVEQSDSTFNKVVSNCVRRWQNLQTVICPLITLDMDALVHLSRMPALIQLSFGLNTTLQSFGPPLSFPNLQALTVHSKSSPLSAVSKLLSQARVPLIMDFITLIGNCPSRQGLSTFLVNVQTSGMSHTIQRLWLYQSTPFGSIYDPETPVLGLDDVRPCMAFSNLHRIDLNIGWNVDLKDNDLLMLASAWPHLELLFINLDWGWNTLGGITPDGLLQLLQICRSLTEIALAINTRWYTEKPRSPGPELSLPRTFAINVLDSIIEAESVPAVAAFFAGIVPRSGFFFSAWDSWIMMEEPGWEIYKRRWDDVFNEASEAVSRRP